MKVKVQIEVSPADVKAILHAAGLCRVKGESGTTWRQTEIREWIEALVYGTLKAHQDERYAALHCPCMGGGIARGRIW